MSSIADDIAELKADIKKIKSANPNWASDAGDKAAITANNNRLANLESQAGKNLFSFITFVPFLLSIELIYCFCSPLVNAFSSSFCYFHPHFTPSLISCTCSTPTQFLSLLDF